MNICIYNVLILLAACSKYTCLNAYLSTQVLAIFVDRLNKYECLNILRSWCYCIQKLDSLHSFAMCIAMSPNQGDFLMIMLHTYFN